MSSIRLLSKRKITALSRANSTALPLLVLSLSLLVLSVSAANPLFCGDADNPGKFFDAQSPVPQCTCLQVPDALDTGLNDGVATTTLEIGEGKTELTNDQLTVTYTAPVKFYNGVAHFPSEVNTNNSCAFQWQTMRVAAPGASQEDPDGCYIQHRGTIAWSDAYRGTSGDAADLDGCGFTRAETADAIQLRLDFSVDFNEDLAKLDTVGSRNTQNGELRTLEFKLPFIVEFPKQVSAATDDVTIFSPVRLLASITRVEVDGDPALGSSQLVGTATMFTSLQWPFVLREPSVNAAQKSNAGVSYVDVAESSAQQCDVGAQCDINAWESGAESADCPACEQTFAVRLQPNADSVCFLNGTYGLDFEVGCHATGPGAAACPLSAGGNHVVNVAFKLETSDMCSQVVDTVAFDLTSLAIYEDAFRSVNKDAFLDGQDMFFQGRFRTPDVTVSSTDIAKIALLRNAQPPVDLFVNGAPTAAGAGLQLRNLVDGGAADPQLGESSLPAFDMTVDSVALGLGPDERQQMQFLLVVDVKYENSGASNNNNNNAKLASHKRTSTTRVLHRIRSACVGKKAASAGTAAPTTQSSPSSSSSSSPDNKPVSAQAAAASVRSLGAQASASIGGDRSVAAEKSDAMFGVPTGALFAMCAIVGFVAAIAIGVAITKRKYAGKGAKYAAGEQEMSAVAPTATPAAAPAAATNV